MREAKRITRKFPKSMSLRPRLPSMDALVKAVSSSETYQLKHAAALVANRLELRKEDIEALSHVRTSGDFTLDKSNQMYAGVKRLRPPLD